MTISFFEIQITKYVNFCGEKIETSLERNTAGVKKETEYIFCSQVSKVDNFLCS